MWRRVVWKMCSDFCDDPAVSFIGGRGMNEHVSWAARLCLSDCYYFRGMHVTDCCHENADI